MANQDIVNYLKEGKEKGFPVDILKNKLVEGGFKESDVSEAVSEIEKSEVSEVPSVGNIKPAENPPKKSKWLKWLLIIFLLIMGRILDETWFERMQALHLNKQGNVGFAFRNVEYGTVVVAQRLWSARVVASANAGLTLHFCP